MTPADTDLTARDIGLDREAAHLVDLLKAVSDELQPLSFVGIHSTRKVPEDIDAALEGTFRLRDERFPLKPPIDWWDEPYKRPDQRAFFQNSFVFADPLLADPRFPEVLVPLASIFVDWLTANPPGGGRRPNPYAWHDHAAAGRIVVMAFALREGVRRGVLDWAVAPTLATGVLAHAEYLLSEDNYAAHYNHGLFSDAALALAARSLSPAPQADAWVKVAERRFDAVLSHTIDPDDAIHLEHSLYYHWIIHGALSRFARAGLFRGLDLGGITQRMEEAGAWLVAPDGTLPPIGDTPFDRRPTAAAAKASDLCSGLRAFPTAGYAAVREGDSALIVTSAHHPTAHKHADDGSFCLYENGRPLVLDSGDPGYDYASAERRYGISPAAHATICVDGFDWARESSPYGSGLVAWTAQDSLYALLMRNPGAVPGGHAAMRVLVYAPGRFLLAIDDVEADSEREIARSLPLAPGLEALITAGGDVEIREAGLPIACLVQLSTTNMPHDGVNITFGRRHPTMSGFSFPSPGRSQPRCEVTLSGAAGHPRAFTLLMTDIASEQRPLMTWEASEGHVDIGIADLIESTFGIEIGNDSIQLRRD